MSGSASPLRQLFHERSVPQVHALHDVPLALNGPDVPPASNQHEADSPAASDRHDPDVLPAFPSRTVDVPQYVPEVPPAFPQRVVDVVAPVADVEPSNASPRHADSARFRQLDFTQAMASVSIPVDDASIRGICVFAPSRVTPTGVLTPASALGQTLSALHMQSPTVTPVPVAGACFQGAGGARTPHSPLVAVSPSGQPSQRSLASALNLKRAIGTPAQKDETITSPHPLAKRRIVALSCEALRLGIANILSTAYETQGETVLLRSMELRHFVGLFEKTRDVDADAFPVAGQLLDTYINDLTKVFFESSCGSVESTLDFVAKYVARR